MSDAFKTLFIYTILCLSYLCVYSVCRVKIKSKRWSIIFIIALVYLVYLLIYWPKIVINNFGVSQNLLFAGIIAAIFAVLHHLSIFIHGKKLFGKFIDEIHGPVSHTVVSLSLLSMAVITWLDFSPHVKTSLDLVVLSFFVSITTIISVFIFLVGWKAVKLWYK